MCLPSSRPGKELWVKSVPCSSEMWKGFLGGFGRVRGKGTEKEKGHIAERKYYLCFSTKAVNATSFMSLLPAKSSSRANLALLL